MELPIIVKTKQEEKESFRIIEEALEKDFILRKQNTAVRLKFASGANIHPGPK